jgi:hypothetical protein
MCHFSCGLSPDEALEFGSKKVPLATIEQVYREQADAFGRATEPDQ